VDSTGAKQSREVVGMSEEEIFTWFYEGYASEGQCPRCHSTYIKKFANLWRKCLDCGYRWRSKETHGED